jgi:hypothetical protein
VCEHGTLSIRMDRADAQALALLRSIRLPADWQTTIERLARDGTELARIEARREQLIDQQRRLSCRYQDGLVSDDEYERTRDQLKTELDRLVIPDSAQTIELGLQMESLGDYLAEATEAEQAEISHLLLEATHFDLAEGRLVRLKPAAEFRFLFDLIGREMNWQAESDGSFRL